MIYTNYEAALDACERARTGNYGEDEYSSFGYKDKYDYEADEESWKEQRYDD